MKYKIFMIVFLFCFFPFASAFHFVYGNVNDALDGTGANDYQVVIWNPANGFNDNLTDTIGPNGASGTDNTYLIDCELLVTPCALGDTITLKLIDFGDGRARDEVNVTITGAGYDVPPTFYLNSFPSFTKILVDDGINFTANEIDLLAGTTQSVVCSAVVDELDGDALNSIKAEFFDSTNSSFNASDDNNNHYTNSTCFINSSYGTENETQINCSFEIEYYSNAGSWECDLQVYDDYSNNTGIDTTTINSLISLEVISNLNFNSTDSGFVSEEEELIVFNRGNIKIDLLLSGYGEVSGDGNAMICSAGQGKNISIDYKKYNLTSSNPGNLTLSEFENSYKNLTNFPVLEDLNLSYRQNDLVDEFNFSTYWRVYVPVGIVGSCTGNIVFGAVAS